MSVSSLPTDETAVLHQLADCFVLSHVETTLHILQNIRGNFGHSLRGHCALCLKRSISPLDPPNRTAVGKRVTNQNRGNERRKNTKGVSSSGLFGVRKHVVFCLGFPAGISLLFDLQSFPLFPVGIFPFSHAAFSSIFPRDITAVLVPANSLKLPGCKVFFPVFSSFSLHRRTPAGRRLAANIARIPAVGKVPIFVSRQVERYRAVAVRFPSNFFPPSPRAVSTVDASSRNALPRGSANSVGDTGFSGKIGFIASAKRAGVSTGRGTRGEWLLSRYFFDARSGRFDETCLPSQLNRRRQREKERENRQKLVISESVAATLPSRVGMRGVWERRRRSSWRASD